MQPCPFTAAQRGDERHSPGVVAFGLDPSSVIPPYGTKGFGALPASDVKPTGGGRGARAIRAEGHRPFDCSQGSRPPRAQNTKLNPSRQHVVAVTISTFRTEFSGRLVNPMESYAGGVTEFLTKGVAADGSIRPTEVQSAANLIELQSRFPKAVVRLSPARPCT